MENKKLAVVVPAFNEGNSIESTLSGLKGIESQLRDIGYTLLIYVVNDGSSDNTAALAQSSGADKIITHKKNRGLGAAVRTGLLATRKDQIDIAIKFDADCQHDPQDIIRIIQPIINDEAEVVYGNRFEKIDYNMPLVRKVGNKVFTRLMATLTGWPLKDSQPGIFAVARDYLAVFHLPGDYNYTQQVLLDAYHQGMRFAHVDVSFHKRNSGKSFVSLKYPVKVLPQLLMVMISIKPMKIFMPIGLVFIALATLIFCWEFGQWLFADAIKPVMHVNMVLGSMLFGMQTLFFGMLAELIVFFNKDK
ncbi:MAG: glycosyltransferase family 2 protein [Sedimentisphaerales bacterium]|nr:glycosyltransferase family 2 protein [Sedimentisphaerales bacterium]MBN2841883.1 glycosyltransferase family 2 protein [Sedimentisphaerales bacterium]